MHFAAFLTLLLLLAVPSAQKGRTPTGTQIEIDTGSPNFTGRARATVFLSALGWSNNLDISLRGEIPADQLRDFVGNLLRQKTPLFRVSGPDAKGGQLQDEPMTRPQVFRLLSDQLRKDVYQPNIVAALRLKRYHLITLAEFGGEEVRYYLGQQSDVKQMPEAARSVMHSILSGEPVGLADLLAMETRQPGRRSYLLTRFSEADFAITYFDFGTLIFMQQTSVSGFHPPRKKAMKCHSSNIRNYLLMTHAASWFYRDTAGTADAKVAALRGYLKTDLELTPSKFSTPFSITFHSHYGPLAKL